MSDKRKEKLPEEFEIHVSLHQYGSRITDVHDYDTIQDVINFLEKRQQELYDGDGISS